MSVFAEKKIPFAVTFGNHDSQQKGDGVYTRQEEYDIFRRMGGEYFVDFDVPELTGAGSGVIPLYSGGKAVFQLIIMDSGDYAGDGGYDGCHSDQIRWYEEHAGILPSLWFQHIIVPDISRNKVLLPVPAEEAKVTVLSVQDASAGDPDGFYSEPLKKRIRKLPKDAVWSKHLSEYILAQPGLTWVADRKKYYICPEGAVWYKPMNAFVKLNTALATGVLAEAPCPPSWKIYTDAAHTYQGRTLYQSWRKMGNVRGAFFGHDHKNTFDATDANGIRIAYSKAVTTSSYNDGDPGFRLFDIRADGTFHTEIVTARQLGVVK